VPRFRRWGMHLRNHRTRLSRLRDRSLWRARRRRSVPRVGRSSNTSDAAPGAECGQHLGGGGRCGICRHRALRQAARFAAGAASADRPGRKRCGRPRHPPPLAERGYREGQPGVDPCASRRRHAKGEFSDFVIAQGRRQQPLAFPVRLGQADRTGQGTVATSKKRRTGAIPPMQCQDTLHVNLLPALSRPSVPPAEPAPAPVYPRPHARNTL
jgi:hypothetical protein